MIKHEDLAIITLVAAILLFIYEFNYKRKKWIKTTAKHIKTEDSIIYYEYDIDGKKYLGEYHWKVMKPFVSIPVYKENKELVIYYHKYVKQLSLLCRPINYLNIGLMFLMVMVSLYLKNNQCPSNVKLRTLTNFKGLN